MKGIFLLTVFFNSTILASSYEKSTVAICNKMTLSKEVISTFSPFGVSETATNYILSSNKKDFSATKITKKQKAQTLEFDVNGSNIKIIESFDICGQAAPCMRYTIGGVKCSPSATTPNKDASKSSADQLDFSRSTKGKSWLDGVIEEQSNSDNAASQ